MSAEEIAATDNALLEDIARLKGLPVGKAVPQLPGSVLYPVSAAAEAARLKAWDEALKTAVPGQEMPDATIYVGKYKPRGLKWAMREEFNVLAAPEDLPEGPRTYVDTVNYMAGLRGWNGYDGAGYAEDLELYEVISRGAYDGKWIIPTLAILCGEGMYSEERTGNNILAHKNKGAFKDTFNIQAGTNDSHRYWSCSRGYEYTGMHYNVSLFDGDSPLSFDSERFSCRPVRLVPCT